MKAVLLAAGQGKRLGKYTHGNPKCLLQLGSETVLAREIRMIREAGIPLEDIYVLGGYKAELLRKIAPNLIVNEDYHRFENSYSLGYALQRVPLDDVIVMDADLCFDSELLLDVLKDEHKNLVLSRISKDENESTGVNTDVEGMVKGIGKNYYNTGYVYMSIFKVSRDVVPVLTEALMSEKNIHTWYTPAITDICERYSFYNLVTDKKWHEIDFIEDYIATKALFGWD